MNLYSLLQSTQNTPDAPCINISVSLADLPQLVVDTIDATRDGLLPLFMKAEEDRLLTEKEVCAKLKHKGNLRLESHTERAAHPCKGKRQHTLPTK